MENFIKIVRSNIAITPKGQEDSEIEKEKDETKTH